MQRFLCFFLSPETRNKLNAGNTFTAVATFLEVDNSLDTIFTGNTIPETAVVDVKNGACFASGSDLGDQVGTPCV